MPYLQINDKQIQLRVGETRIGVGAQVEVRLPAPAAAGGSGVLAIIELGHASHGAIRRAGADAVVRVNGLQLGAEPTPLIHGDKIEVGGSELFYGDDRKGGSTQFIAASNIPDYGRLRAAPPLRATAATGGRVISLVDGREYTVAAVGLVFGRDAGCDVVVPSTEVSRRHAEIVAGDSGYVVTDTSTNGVFVNGVRVEGIQILGRGDIVRIGGEEFRFYADVLPSAAGTPASVRQEGAGGSPAAPPAPAQAAVASTPPNPAPASAPRAAVPAAAAAAFAEIEAVPGRQLPDEPSPAPIPSSVPRPASRGAIASLNVIGGGVLRGEQYGITTVLAHVGRGEHNDVVIPEESISDSHAKLQRRDGVWYVIDLGSTNGTYVAGRRIDAEEVLGQAGELRLGGVKLMFNAIGSEPTTGPRDATREFSGAMASEAARRASLPAPAAAEPVAADARVTGRAPRGARSARPPVTTAPTAEASWVWWLVAAVIVGGLGSMIYFLFVKSH